jgi:hypothetical protein
MLVCRLVVLYEVLEVAARSHRPCRATDRWHGYGAGELGGALCNIPGVARCSFQPDTEPNLFGQHRFRVVVTNTCGSSAAQLGICQCLECSADFNQDGGIDGGDVDAFFLDRGNRTIVMRT